MTLLKNKYQRGVDSLLQEACAFSDGDPTMAITMLMAAAIYLQQQIEMPKADFLKGAALQWDDVESFMSQLILETP